MYIAGENEKEKNELIHVKTFNVPFSFEEVIENITITTQTIPNPSKAKIINQAIKLHQKGNIQESIKYYKYFINEGFEDHRAFFNYGAILQDLGKLEEAEKFIRKSIEIKSDIAEAHFSLGNILRELGRSKLGFNSIALAIEISASFDLPSSLNIFPRLK